MNSPHAQRILIIRLGSLGDLVHTMPAAAALRTSFPDAKLDWVVEQKWSGLIGIVEGVDEVIGLRRSAIGMAACARRLRASRYDCVLDFQGLYKSALLARLSGAKRRIGRDRSSAREPGAAWFYTERVAPQGSHVAEMNLSLARHAGAEGAKLRFPLCVPDSEIRAMRERLLREGVEDYVVLSPGGGWKSKCWPPDRYAELCRELWKRRGIRSVMNAGPGEENLAREIADAAQQAKPLVLCPSLVELAALLAGARVVVAADTGPLHLAAALGTRVVALFGPTNPARNGPLPGGLVLRAHSAAADESPLGDPKRGDYLRSDGYSRAMLSLSTAEVLAALEQEMDEEMGKRI